MEREPLYGGEPDGAIRGRHTKCAVEQTWGSLVTLSSWMQWFTFTSMPVLPLYLQHHTYKLGTPLSPINSPELQSLLQPLCSFTPPSWVSGWLAGCVNALTLWSCCTMMSGSEEWEPARWHTQKHISARINQFGWKSLSWCYRSKSTNTGQNLFFSNLSTKFKIYLSKHIFNLIPYKLILSNYLCLKLAYLK